MTIFYQVHVITQRMGDDENVFSFTSREDALGFFNTCKTINSGYKSPTANVRMSGPHRLFNTNNMKRARRALDAII